MRTRVLTSVLTAAATAVLGATALLSAQQSGPERVVPAPAPAPSLTRPARDPYATLFTRPFDSAVRLPAQIEAQPGSPGEPVRANPEIVCGMVVHRPLGPIDPGIHAMRPDRATDFKIRTIVPSVCR